VRDGNNVPCRLLMALTYGTHIPLLSSPNVERCERGIMDLFW